MGCETEQTEDDGMIRQILLVSGFIMLFSFHGKAQEVTEVSIAWEDGLKPPYLMLDENRQPTGIAVDILNIIFAKHKIEISHHIFPWKRCLMMVKNDQIDIVPNASYKEERARFAYYTRPLYKTHLVLFYNKNRFQTPPQIFTLQDLKPYKTGGVLGFNYAWYEGKINIDTGTLSREALIEKLRIGRLDFAILQKEVLLRLQHEGKVTLSDLGTIPEPVKPVKEYHVLTARTPRGKILQDIINEGIDELSRNGIIEKIMARYLGNS